MGQRREGPSLGPSSPSYFGDFLEAASRRYPRIRLWMLWGEPTKVMNFQPLTSDGGCPLRGRAALAGPRRYAQLLDAGYASLKRVSARTS